MLLRIKRKRLYFLAIISCFLLVFLGGPTADRCLAKSLPAQGIVVAVIDGDTVVLDSGKRVRYLGIDAPEVSHGETPGACFGREARKANSLRVLHRKVTLKYEEKTRDSHGRLLAYVYSPDGLCVNGELVKDGYAWVFKGKEGFGLWREFVKYQQEAVRHRRGMWGACQVEGESYYLGSRLSHIFHRPSCSLVPHRRGPRWPRFQTRWEVLESAYSPCRRCKP